MKRRRERGGKHGPVSEGQRVGWAVVECVMSGVAWVMDDEGGVGEEHGVVVAWRQIRAR